MSVKLEIVKSNLQKETGNSFYYPKVVTYSTYTTDEFIEMLSTNEGIGIAQAKSVLTAFANELMKHLSQGHKVKINGIGTFSLNIAGKATVSENNKIVTNNLRFDKINITPDTKARNSLNSISKSINKKEIKIPCKFNFEKAVEQADKLLENSSLFHAEDFALAAGISKNTTYRIVNKLVNANILERKGKRRQYTYIKGSANRQ